ncbi:hypothetical protein ACFE04_023814 [Oxalis oulophora]
MEDRRDQSNSRHNPELHSTPTPVIPQPIADKAPAVDILVKYKECLKNHAASIGSHVLDGCGEFMPSGEDNTPEALKCAACECHRNFHRKEIDHTGEEQPSHYQYPSPNKPINSHQTRVPTNTSLALRIHSFNNYHRSSPPIAANGPMMMMAFGGGNGGCGAESSSEDINLFDGGGGPGGQAKKRFRTKFNGDQKDKMMEFAEKIGWKFQKQDEVEIQRFCKQLGVKRQVFKVWMHNNKHSIKKKQM